MAKRKPIKTENLRRRLKARVRSFEKRGLFVPEDVREKIKTGKYQTLKSFERENYKKLYSVSTGEVNGKVVSGTQYREYERREAARKAQETKRQREEAERVRREREEQERQEREWEEERRRRDEFERQRAEKYQEGELVYDEVVRTIEDYPTEGSKYLRAKLNAEISSYGKDRVILALAEAPSDAIAYAKVICYYEDEKPKIQQAMHEFLNIIRGTKESADEAKETGEVMDRMTDMSAP
jgi:hypothetical protein